MGVLEGMEFAVGMALRWSLLCAAGLVAVVLVFYTIVGIQSLRAQREYRKLNRRGR